MKLKCPNCGNLVTELLSCENCKAIGCIRCIVKSGKQWICSNCKNQITTEPTEAGLFSMFG